MSRAALLLVVVDTRAGSLSFFAGLDAQAFLNLSTRTDTMPQDNQQAVWDQAYNYRKNKYVRLVAEGDSWFCYPMWRSMLDFVSESNKSALCRRGESGRLLQQIVGDGKYLKGFGVTSNSAPGKRVITARSQP